MGTVDVRRATAGATAALGLLATGCGGGAKPTTASPAARPKPALSAEQIYRSSLSAVKSARSVRVSWATTIQGKAARVGLIMDRRGLGMRVTGPGIESDLVVIGRRGWTRDRRPAPGPLTGPSLIAPGPKWVALGPSFISESLNEQIPAGSSIEALSWLLLSDAQGLHRAGAVRVGGVPATRLATPQGAFIDVSDRAPHYVLDSSLGAGSRRIVLDDWNRQTITAPRAVLDLSRLGSGIPGVP